MALLDEGRARLLAAQRALELGRGGVSRVAKLTGMSRVTITRGVADLRDPKTLKRLQAGRSRRYGGGRKGVKVTDPGLIRALTTILDESTMGDPMAVLKWTNKSTRTIADELKQQGHPVSHVTVASILASLDYSLQATRRRFEGEQHVDRDAQFQYINATVKEFMVSGDPVISVDTKKREFIGRFKNAGQTYRPRGEPQESNAYDYRSQADGIAHPYGAYDEARNEGFVNVGVSADTAEFAVESIRRWWKMVGKPTYPKATRLLICADGGGSNGSRRRTWKWQLHNLATELDVPITVCHYPPGTSKWNKIEHRLFSQISSNWRGKMLVDYQTVVDLIGNTKTRTGLKVKALLDTKEYKTGIEISDAEMAAINLKKHETHPVWNYTVSPGQQKP